VFAAQQSECLVKNEVGVGRFEDEAPGFYMKYYGCTANFCDGKFMRWECSRDEISIIKIPRRAVSIFEIDDLIK
jgi:hypothetical protein